MLLSVFLVYLSLVAGVAALRCPKVGGGLNRLSALAPEADTSDMHPAELVAIKDELKTSRARSAIPKGDSIDQLIFNTALPSVANLAVVPLVGAVDTFFIGRLGSALALAGQGAANQCFFTIYFIISFIPTITAPLVAKAIAKGDRDAAADRVAEAMFLCHVMGGLGTALLLLSPGSVLRLVLKADAPAYPYAAQYLSLRALGLVPALLSSLGFAAYRGLQDTVTPLKVSVFCNLVNLVGDPLLMFWPAKLGVAGAALATAISEMASAVIYLRLLLKQRLIRWSRIFTPPTLKTLLPLIQGGAAMLARQMALNVAFLSATRRAQAMDPTGVSAAAYGIAMQIYTLGVVIQLAMQTSAAALVPAAREKDGDDRARDLADRLMVWGCITGVSLCVLHLLALPLVTPLFTPRADIQAAVRGPGIITALIQLLNGPIFAGEGLMLGMGQYKDLAVLTSLGVILMLALLSSPFLGTGLNAVVISLAGFHAVQSIGVVLHHLKRGPLARRKVQKTG